jgi:hypothetical protein
MPNFWNHLYRTIRTRHLLFVFLFLFLFTGLLFRKYFFEGLIPFPSNLLISFYEPWRSYPTPEYPNGPPNKPIGFDNLRMFYPLRNIANNQFQSGKIPLWNPYSFAGNTLHGVYQSAVFFPLGFLFLWLPQIDAWSLILILAPVFTGWGMYLFLFDLTGSRKASFFGAVTYAYSGMMICWWQEMFMSVYSMLPLPVVLLAMKKLQTRFSRKYLLLFVAAVCFSVYSGYFQTTFYLLLTAGLWFFFLFFTGQRQTRIRFLAWVLLGLVFAAGLSALQLVSAWESYFLSVRSGFDVKAMFNDYFIPLRDISSMFAPDYFGNPATYNYFGGLFYHEKVLWIGIPGLIFFLFALLNLQRLSAEAKFFTLTGILLTTLAFNLPTSWLILYQIKLPFVSEMTPSRIVYLSVFFFSLVSSYGLKFFMQKTGKRNMKITLIVMAIIYLVMIFVPIFYFKRSPTEMKVALKNLVLPISVFGIFVVSWILAKINEFWKQNFYNLCLLLSLLNIYYFSNKYLYFSEKRFLYPDNPLINELHKVTGKDRVWTFGSGYILPNFNNYLKLYSPEGYESFNPRIYNELVSTTFTGGKLEGSHERADVAISPMQKISEFMNYPHSRKMLDLLSVKYIAAHNDGIDVPDPEEFGFIKVWSDEKYTILKNTRSLPRVYLAGSIQVASGQEAIDLLYQENSPVSRLAVLDKNITLNLSPEGEPAGTVEISKYQPDEIVVKTDSKKRSAACIK